jgi:hypothetical protein
MEGVAAGRETMQAEGEGGVGGREEGAGLAGGTRKVRQKGEEKGGMVALRLRRRQAVEGVGV